MFVATRPQRFVGTVTGDGHCVALVRAASGAPHTSAWRRGLSARGSQLPTGTAIATFNSAGRYANATDGSSHAAILLAEEEAGLRVIDQWVGQPGFERVIRYQGSTPANDGNAFHQIVAEQQLA